MASKGVADSARDLSSEFYQVTSIAEKSDEEVSSWESIIERGKGILMLIANTSRQLKKAQKWVKPHLFRKVSQVRIQENCRTSRKATSGDIRYLYRD